MNLFKNVSITFLLVIFLVGITNAVENNFSYKPEKPQANSKITVTYNPEGTSLNGSESISMFVYEYGKNLYNTEEFPMKKSGGNWIGSFTPSDSTLGISIVFSNGGDKDINRKQTYVIHLYQDGKPLPGTYAGLGVGYASWFGIFEIDNDQEKAYELFKQEFSLNPSLKKDYINYYFSSVLSNEKEKGRDIVLSDLTLLENTGDTSEDFLGVLVSWSDRLKDVERSAKLKAIINEKYPNGSYAQLQKYMAFRGVKELDQKIKLADEYALSYPNGKFLSNFNYDIFRVLNQNGKFAEAKEFLEKKLTDAKANSYNSLAWSMYEKDFDLESAAIIAKKGIELARSEINNPAQPKPGYMATKEWEDVRKGSLGMILDTYGMILKKLGKNTESFTALQEAVEMNKYKDPEMNQNYVTSLMDAGNYKKAQSELEKFISDGTSTAKMKEMLKEVFVKNNGSENGFDSYYSKFEEAAKVKLIQKLKKEIIDEPAPQFSLIDLEGKNVSLADFKGKTVIVDFWATWCGPCISSFPGMKKAIEQYEQTGKAKFLFVNTWENVENKKQNASDFIAKNSYPFHVLLDEKNEVISSYKVSGIPTKFIIDKNGKVRFKSVGFGGNTDEMVEEIGVMIDMIQ
ncbi:MAG: redoxin domain-containing protein [Bacteroidota bacterium]